MDNALWLFLWSATAASCYTVGIHEGGTTWYTDVSRHSAQALTLPWNSKPCMRDATNDDSNLARLMKASHPSCMKLCWPGGKGINKLRALLVSFMHRIWSDRDTASLAAPKHIRTTRPFTHFASVPYRHAQNAEHSNRIIAEGTRTTLIQARSRGGHWLSCVGLPFGAVF